MYLLAGSAAALAAPALAQGSWPNRLVKIIVPWPPGGGTDVIARLIAQHLQVRLRQNFIIENRTGGSGTIGTEQVARAAPDGYTFAINSSGPITILPHLMRVSYDPLRSLTPVALYATTSLLLVVANKSPFTSFAELIKLARQNREKYNICNDGMGSPSLVIAEMFVRAFNLEMVHVPYRGGAPAINDTMGDHCDMLFESNTASLPLVHSGQLRALAITDTKRFAELPDVPTVIENGANDFKFEPSTWSAMFAPAGSPAEIVSLLNREIRAFMAMPAQQERMLVAGSLPKDLSPDALAQYIQQESNAWSEVIREANIKL